MSSIYYGFKYGTVGSASVVTSPIDPSSPEEIFRNIRRIILPERVYTHGYTYIHRVHTW